MSHQRYKHSNLRGLNLRQEAGWWETNINQYQSYIWDIWDWLMNIGRQWSCHINDRGEAWPGLLHASVRPVREPGNHTNAQLCATIRPGVLVVLFWPKFWSHWLILYDLNLLVQAPLLLSSKPAIKPSIAFTKKPKASFGTQMVNVAHDVALDGPAVPCCSG